MVKHNLKITVTTTRGKFERTMSVFAPQCEYPRMSRPEDIDKAVNAIVNRDFARFTILSVAYEYAS